MNLRTKLTVMLLVLLVLLGAANVALAERAGDFEYRIENGTATIMRYSGRLMQPIIPAMLGGKPVTAIGDGAFARNRSLSRIAIPDSVTSIGNGAFSGCSSLTSIAIPGSVTSIGDSAFAGCSSLAALTLPDSVTTIGNRAFFGCSGLTALALPDSVTTIGDSAFEECIGLTALTLPDSVMTIGDSAFKECIGLTALTLPDSVTTIGNRAFSGCSGLTTLTLPDSVTTIGDSAFKECIGLTALTLPDSVTTIGNGAFSGCSSLTIVSSNAAAAKDYSWGSGVQVGLFEGDFIYGVSDGQATIEKYIGSAEKLTIPATLGGYPVAVIGNHAFKYRSSLTHITLPDSVTSIDGSAFINCTNLASISIPDSVTFIGNDAFSGCTSLTNISIPDSVTFIGINAFWGCTSLTTVNTSSAAAQSYPWPAGVRVGLIDGDFSYFPVGDTAYCLMTYSGDAAVIVAPTSYNGKPVTKINSDAFGKSVTIFVADGISFDAATPCWRYIVAPDGTFCLTGTNINDSRLILPAEACGTPITAIGDHAFANNGLSFVFIPDSIVSVGVNPFSKCANLATIVVNPENTGLYVSADGALYSKADKRLVCFPAGVTANRLTVPAGVRSVGAYAMYGVQATEIVLPDSVTKIGEAAFAENRNLTEIVLPVGLAEIQAQAFYGCDKLSALALPSSLTGIGAQAFYDCDGLRSVTLHGGLQTLGEMAFASCSNLQFVAIPDSVTQIGADAFSGAPLLTLYVEPGSHAAAYARENMLHALYPDSDSWLAE